jgi:hypothetical protein
MGERMFTSLKRYQSEAPARDDPSLACASGWSRFTLVALQAGKAG